jgi:hypothetical protein
LDVTEGKLKYYLKKFGIIKVPPQALTQIVNVTKLRTFLKKPIDELAKPLFDETEEEFRKRYITEMNILFRKLKRFSTEPEEYVEEIKATKSAIEALKSCMFLEMEGRKILNVSDDKKYELKEREITKNEPKENVVVNFNGNIMAQTLFATLKQSLEASGKFEEDELEKIMLESAMVIENG